jgi:Transposase DDE domain
MDEQTVPPPPAKQKKKEPIKEAHRLRIVERANKLFGRLSKAGTERDTAGNRELLYSHYASLVLLSLFNPAMHALRGIQEASQLKKVQKRLGTGRVSLGSLSESSRVFDPHLLLPIIDELLADLPPQQHGPGPRRAISDTIPKDLASRLVATDGSALRALPQIVRATADGPWKLHLQFRPLRGLPGSATLEREYAVDERAVLAETLEPGCVYIADRGYEQYSLYNRIVNAKSDYVIRGQERPVEIVDERPLSAEAIQARVASDAVVTIGPKNSTRRTEAVDHPLRRIVIIKRDQGRVRSDRPTCDQVILYTNLLDVPAEVVAAIYELRWSIELFFRFLKQVLGCRRLFSDKPEAAAIQVYCALIACLLLARVTGGRVTMKAFRLISFYIQGWADDDELDEGLRRIRKKEP